MEILKFTLSGKQAMFKKPEVNAIYYYTYGQIHKPALLGMFGAILGYGGYNQMKKSDKYPAYYQKLKPLQISILPNAQKGYFAKKIVHFNNSVGYASREQGGNLIVKEQWLEYPSWDIFVLLDCDEANKLADSIVGRKCVYIPYLGKNDHLADITQVSVLEGSVQENAEQLNCLFPKYMAEIDTALFDDGFKYEEALPIGLDEQTHQYQLQRFVYTDMILCDIKNTVWEVDGKQIVFY